MKRILVTGCVTLVCMFIFCACSQTPSSSVSGLYPNDFKAEKDGQQTGLYILKNSLGMEVCITNFGGRVVSIMVPDREDKLRDVVLGFSNATDYMEIPSDFGASIGRYANRIGQGLFTLDSTDYQLPKNNFGHCLHGGPKGWQYKIYEVEKVSDNSITLVRNSPDGDESFPGNVTAKVTFTVTTDNALEIAYQATTDKPTVINMTNHSYFNLSGDAANSILDHVLYVNAQYFTPVGRTLIPTGEIVPVAGTPMDFTIPKVIGKDIDSTGYEQIRFGNGYDHNWILDTKGDMGAVAATLFSPESGIKLDVYTDEPGIQVYSGNFLDGKVTGKNGIVYQKRAAICLETQHYPDSPNKPEWPTTVLRPGETYTSHCTYKFSTITD
ncbi:MAG TPA: aldose epimerase family protein [Bacteroidales bacterium]|jgi:aldose 1-epimerase|nr:galactose mutarotase [Bacteroidales bacterium]OQC56875.1 MAG: Aldose 1-epimerase precursor [Bacteroidetes bacterium ADurb.Bin013]MBV6456306.1 Aldose 1-epimerase [Bacteroidales bacterium]MCZ2316351.1 galactose mutarotase [Bacteroidales bacterium]HNR27668.1 aldose epimerase family protein [Bacteroidales bacterium]